MKIPTKIRSVSLALLVFGAGLLVIAKLVFAAGTATLYLSPASGTFAQGDTISIDIYEDSGTDTVNAVQANLSYPDNLLNFTGITSSSAFNVEAQSTGGNGSVQIARGATTPVSGNQLVATVRFTAAAGGQANISFTSGSAVIRSTDNGAQTLTTTGASYTINSQSTIYLSPASRTYNQGDAVAVSIYVNSGSVDVNAVQANLNYTNNLTFNNIDASSSAFAVQAQNDGGGGSVQIARGTTTPVNGLQLVAIVNFTASGGGNAVITFADGTALVRSSDNGSESLSMTGSSYSISTPSNPSPPPPPPPPSSVNKNPKPAPKLVTNKPNPAQANPNNPPSANKPVEPPLTTNLDKEAPVITDIKAVNLSTKSATITWRTSEPATSEVNYGLSTKYVLSAVDTKYTKTHSITLNPKDLVPRTVYHFRVKSVDAAGNVAVSKDVTFKTEVPKKPVSNSFWKAFAVSLVIGGAALVGVGYFRRLRGQGPFGGAGGSSGDSLVGPSGSDPSSETIVTGSSSAADKTTMKTSDEVITIQPNKQS